MPGFWGALVAMLEALPLNAEILGLQATHPLIRSLALEGHRWCTSADMLVGPFWVIRRESLIKFLTWRENELREGWREPTSQKLPQLTEDTMVGVWALATGRKIGTPSRPSSTTTQASPRRLSATTRTSIGGRR